MTSILTNITKMLPEKRINIFGSNDILMTSLPYYTLFLIIFLCRNTIFSEPWFFVALIYAIVPLLDEVFKRDYRNPSDQERRQLEQNDVYFKGCLWLTVVMDWYIFYKAITFFSEGEYLQRNIFELIGIVFVFSMLNAIQFTVAHEIFHKAGSINKILGTIHMSKNLYTHFTYEHLYGHHRKVATPDDPASASQHSDVYSFAWKSAKGTLLSVYNMELEAGKKIYENCAVLSVAWSLVFTAAIYAFFGFYATTFFLIQAFVSIFFLETINYIEHYGLRRKQLEDGSYEKVTIRHSWNAPHRFTNYILFKLQRHSDHHENAMKPYQTLLSLKESPQLPHGYSLMILMAFVPSVWFRIMDPLVDEYKKTGHGAIKSEVTEKAIQKSKEFAVVMGAMAIATWGLDMLI